MTHLSKDAVGPRGCASRYEAVLSMLVIAALASCRPSPNSTDLAWGARPAGQAVRIDVHEHVSDESSVAKFLDTMEGRGFGLVCLVASPTFTLTSEAGLGFEGHELNNELLLKAKARWPSKVAAFVTIDPADEGHLSLLQHYAARGADGLKLYLGHGGTLSDGTPFHSMALDDTRLDPLWRWLETNQFPTVLHVNLSRFWDELLRLMERYPYLRINLPHFGVYTYSERQLSRLTFLLNRYPFLYSDVSFGSDSLRVDGLRRLSSQPELFRGFVLHNQSKLLFAADLVVTPAMSREQISEALDDYSALFEDGRSDSVTIAGLRLPPATRRKLYFENARTWLLLSNGRLPDRTQGRLHPSVRLPKRPKVPPLRPGDRPR